MIGTQAALTTRRQRDVQLTGVGGAGSALSRPYHAPRRNAGGYRAREAILPGPRRLGPAHSVASLPTISCGASFIRLVSGAPIPALRSFGHLRRALPPHGCVWGELARNPAS